MTGTREDLDWQAVFFDFDGVITDTGDVKANAFATLFALYGPDVQEAVVAYHRQNGGIPRQQKLRHCLEEIAGKPCSEEKLAELGAAFAGLVFDGVLAAPLVPGALAALQDLRTAAIPAFVVSGTPQAEMRRVIEGRNLSTYFTGVYGAPRRKEEILADLLARRGSIPEHCLFIGDALADWQAASGAGLAFLGIVLPGRASAFPPEVLTASQVRLPARRELRHKLGKSTLPGIPSLPSYAAQTAEALRALRARRPLVHSITNYVAANFVANVLLASGASPAMADAAEEVEEMAALAGAVALNIGTLKPVLVEAMIKAGKRAKALGRPLMLDPAGAGATSLRTEVALRILTETRVSVLRGNASEILALSGGVNSGGLDAGHAVEEAVEAAVGLARYWGIIVALTGESDLVTDGTCSLKVYGGHALMPMVTGTGCALSALVGAFLAVEPDPLAATAAALAFFALAGEKAGKQAAGPGSFAAAFLDALAAISPEEVAASCQITVL